MERIMLLQKNASVIGADGEQVGSLERVVLNPESKMITDIVVRTGTIFKQAEKVVPVGDIVETDENQVVLNHAAEELESFPPLEERHVVETEQRPPVISGAPGLYGPAVVPSAGEKFFTQTEQNIPDGTVAMKEGAKVITADGKHVGNVERVLADASVDQVTNLEISKGLFSKEWRLIPMKWVKTIDEDEIHLRVNEDAIDDE
jgi:uncharacterized protein YrrD